MAAAHLRIGSGSNLRVPVAPVVAVRAVQWLLPVAQPASRR